MDDLLHQEPIPSMFRARPDRQRLRRTLYQLCVGVNAMHAAGYIHRDLKPSNVLVTPAGRVVVLDFGLVRQTGTLSLRGDGLQGTPSYMAPEQALEQTPHPAADWYAVGTMLYEALTGRLPYDGDLIEILTKKDTADPPSPEKVNPRADPELSRLCMQLLQCDPARRPPGAEILGQLGGNITPAPRSPSDPAQVSSGGPVFIGRTVETQSLQRCYRTACGGSAATVLVEGISGVGKTTLVECFLDQITGSAEPSRKPIILRGRWLRLRGIHFKERPSSSIPVEQARLLDVLWSVNTGLGRGGHAARRRLSAALSPAGAQDRGHPARGAWAERPGRTALGLGRDVPRLGPASHVAGRGARDPIVRRLHHRAGALVQGGGALHGRRARHGGRIHRG
jgi:hypothetical protein